MLALRYLIRRCTSPHDERTHAYVEQAIALQRCATQTASSRPESQRFQICYCDGHKAWLHSDSNQSLRQKLILESDCFTLSETAAVHGFRNRRGNGFEALPPICSE